MADALQSLSDVRDSHDTSHQHPVTRAAFPATRCMSARRLRSIAVPVSCRLAQVSAHASQHGMATLQCNGRRWISALAWSVTLAILSGCQSGPQTVPTVTYTPHASAVGRMAAPPAMPLPPAPASQHGDRVSERALRHQATLTPTELPAPASVAPPADGLAPRDTSATVASSSQPALATESPTPLAGAAAAAASAATVSSADQRPTPQSAFESRLAALEQEWQTKQQVFESLQTRCQLQNEELAQVRAALETARLEIERLEKTVGTQHQRDVASLEQLSHTLEQLLQSETASSPLESP